MSITSIVIPFVEPEYTAEFIANVFWRQLIAQVGIITLLTYSRNNNIYSMAYVTIDEWHDSENAYNFIQRLKNPNMEARLVYSEDNWWNVYINTNNNYNNYKLITGLDTTTIFNTYYFKSRVEYEEDDELTISTRAVSDEYTESDSIETQDPIWNEAYNTLSKINHTNFPNSSKNVAKLWV
jgi:hypothetical protein